MKEIVKEKIVTRDFCLLFLVSVAICTGMNMLNVIVPLYVTETLHGSNFVSGLMTTLYTVSACVSRPLNGLVTDRLGRRRTMLLGSLVFAGGCLFAGLIPTIVALALCRIFMGIGYSAASTANNTASTDIIPVARMSEGIGYFGMSQSVASAIGPALGSMALLWFGNRASLLAVAAIACVALLSTIWIRYESKPNFSKPVATEKSGGFLERTALLPALFQGLFLFVMSCLMCFMPLYLLSRGYSSALSGWYFVIASVVIVGVRLCFSGLMNRIGALPFLIPGFLSLILLCFSLPRVSSTVGFLFCGLLHGLAHGPVWMALGSEAVRIARPERRGQANATFYFAFDAGIGLGAAFWGMMLDHITYNACFTAVALATVALLCASIPVFRARAKLTI